MAWLDVTEVLLDPMFASKLSVVRNTQTVGTDGMASTTQVNKNFTGVVTSSNGAILNRIAEGERIIDTIVIHSKYPLIDGQQNETADIVTWQNRQWTVTNVNDYSHFGPGFTAAICTLIPLSG